jgi:hypothetical protein
MLLFERMLGEESPSFVSVSLLNSFNLGGQKKEDIDRLCNKIRRMPLKRSVKDKLCLEIRKEEVKFNSLEELRNQIAIDKTAVQKAYDSIINNRPSL